jgi:hypothetical protein
MVKGVKAVFVGVAVSGLSAARNFRWWVAD